MIDPPRGLSPRSMQRVLSITKIRTNEEKPDQSDRLLATTKI